MTNEKIVVALRHCTDESKELCPPCPYFSWDKQKDNTGCMGEVMLDAADALEAAEKRIAELEAQLPKWISMEDRLPEKMKNVLAANNRGKQWDIDKAWYNGAYFDRCGKRPLSHVTHWMPLPDAPEVEG